MSSDCQRQNLLQSYSRRRMASLVTEAALDRIHGLSDRACVQADRCFRALHLALLIGMDSGQEAGCLYRCGFATISCLLNFP